MKPLVWLRSLNVRGRVIATLVVLIVGTPVAFFAWLLWVICGPNPAVHKFVMPGDYKVHLAPGQYSGWIFTLWRSKQVEALPSASMAVSIVDPGGGQVKQEEGIGLTLDDNQRRGRVEFYFKIEKAGSYTISSKGPARLVFAVVEAAHYGEDFGGNPTFQGEYGDFNFETRQ